MKIGRRDLDEEVLVVAEIGNNHEGSFALAEELVGKAAEVGVGAVKFQTFRSEHYVSRRDADRFARLKGFELSGEEFGRLAEQARVAGLAFISTPFDLHSATLLGEIADAIKISSGDNTFYPLIDAVARSGLPLLFSTGIADPQVVRAAAGRISAIWATNGDAPGYVALHCVSSYPTAAEDANLGCIPELARLLPEAAVGYSDHTLGVEAAALAVALGARVIEKHFTIRKDYSDFRDHQLSADPEEMRVLVQRVDETQRMVGQGVISVRQAEEPVRVAIRRSIVTTRALSSGAILGPDDITWVRPGGGLPPGSEGDVLGRQLKVDLEEGDMVLAAHLQGCR